MRLIAAGLTCVLMLVSCSAEPELDGSDARTVQPVPTSPPPAPTPEPLPEPTSPLPTPTPTATVEPLNGAPGFDALRPLGVTTSTGVPVAVLGEVAEGLVVRTPCGRTATVAGGEPLGEVRVVLDPGHGGPIDTGAVGAGGLVERDLNLDVAFAAREELLERDIGVALTRTADYATILPVRAEFADGLRAEALVSIHHNAPMALPSDIPGTEIFVQSTSRQSRRLGGVLYERLVDALSVFENVDWQAADDAGVIEVLNTRGTDAYGMIRRPNTPSALLEIGYLANPSEEALMTTSEYIEVAALAIADGVEDYLETAALGGGYVLEPRVFDPAAAPGASLCEDPLLE